MNQYSIRSNDTKRFIDLDNSTISFVIPNKGFDLVKNFGLEFPMEVCNKITFIESIEIKVD